jgi:hypothetical protein
MHGVTTIGLDIAKSVFQVHGIDAIGKVVIRRQLKRRQVPAFFQKLATCVVGIEACATSHHWSRDEVRGRRAHHHDDAHGLPSGDQDFTSSGGATNALVRNATLAAALHGNG